MGDNSAFIRKKRSNGWEVTNRLYGAVRENSIDFSRIPYRLFPNTSVHPLGQHGSNDLIALEERFVRMGQLLRVLGRKGRERAQV